MQEMQRTHKRNIEAL